MCIYTLRVLLITPFLHRVLYKKKIKLVVKLEKVVVFLFSVSTLNYIYLLCLCVGFIGRLCLGLLEPKLFNIFKHGLYNYDYYFFKHVFYNYLV